MERTLSFVEAIREATIQQMELDPSVIVFGLDVDDPKAINDTTRGLVEQFGSERVFGTPLSEDAMTGAAIGMSLSGLRPVHVHIRMDFMMLAMNQLVNIAAKSRYMYGGQVKVPIVVRSMIGKSWGQGAQHSQGLYSMFMNIPGIKVVVPSNPYDAKGCMIGAIRDDDPVVYVDHRLLHFQSGPVPAEPYTVEQGKARVTVKGDDVTLVGISHMLNECMGAQIYLESVGVSAEVIDPIWLKPLDKETIIESVRKTGRLCVVDNGWTTCGAGAEIISLVTEALGSSQEMQVSRMGFAPVACPPTPALEDLFYPNAQTIASTVYDLVKGHSNGWIPDELPELKQVAFKGPF